MAELRHATDGNRIRPATRCLVGRAPSCHLVLADPSVSREHAVIFYDGSGWNVRDLSSRNGTTVDAKRILGATSLNRDSVVTFGSDSNTWQLVETDPPCLAAISPQGARIRGTAIGLFLPSETQFEAFVSEQDGQWVVEHENAVRQVTDQQQVTLSEGVWTLELTCGDERSVAATTVNPAESVHLAFAVSPDEEHVELTAEHDGQVFTIAHRSHNYLLLLLARARLRDQRSSQVQASEHGWLETRELADMLRTNNEQVNVWIFRARAQFQKLAPSIADRLIERRPTLGQLRIGFGNLTVLPH